MKLTPNNKTAGRRSPGAEGEIRTLDQGLMSPLLITCKSQVANVERHFQNRYFFLYMAVF